MFLLKQRARKLGRRLFHRLYHGYALRQIAKPSTRLLGRTLLTDPDVFHPVYFLSTKVFLDYLATLDLAGKRFLDMGTGSGAVGIFAAARGAQVTACDINPRAVRLAARNAQGNGVQMEVVESDLFDALDGRLFDVIAFNLPFYAEVPRPPMGVAFYAGPNFETIRSFAAGCRRALAPGGSVVVIFSEDSGRDRVVALFEAEAFASVDEHVASRFFERFHLLKLHAVP
jgi:methylase of polypeptide subunit release factors